MKIKSLILSSLVSVLFLAPMAVQAAEVGAPAKSQGAVNFEEGTGTVDPTDPTNPDPKDPYVPEKPNPGGDGFLRIDQASDLNFGTMKIGKTSIGYAKDVKGNIAGTDSYIAPYIQITDERSGDYKGWNLTMKASEFKAYTKGTEGTPGVLVPGAAINSATIEFAVPYIQSNSAFPDEQKPVGQSVEIAANDSVSNKELITAAANKGGGQWSAIYAADISTKPEQSPTERAEGTKSGIKLTVPASAKKNKDYNYVSDLTWTIASTPEG